MFSSEAILASGSLVLIGLVIFAETGLLFGVVLPGDTLLFPAGIFAATGKLELLPLLATVYAASFVGNNVGYEFGKRAGPKLFKKEDSLIFHKDQLLKATAFYEKHGGKALVVARFLPGVRTLAPIVAGMGKMNKKSFMVYNAFAAVLWGSTAVLLGYFFGSKIPDVERYALPGFIVVDLFIWGPVAYKAFKNPAIRARILKMVGRSKVGL
jgi:membrane-associated protein